ncbi:MAG: type II secretion system protein XpsI [Lysobacter sp.]
MHALARQRTKPSRGSRSARLGPARSQQGYTLIEVIVAFALLAAALTLLLGTLSGATRQVRWSGDAGRATLHAHSLLDTVGIVEPVKAGERQGDFDEGRYRWSLRISRWEDPEPAPRRHEPESPESQVLYELDLDVRWGDGGARERLQWQTLRLGPAGTTDRGAP